MSLVLTQTTTANPIKQLGQRSTPPSRAPDLVNARLVFGVPHHPEIVGAGCAGLVPFCRS
ncbi:MAG: hypothetical protein ABSG90_11745 [Dehalococcoidia bacterium]